MLRKMKTMNMMRSQYNKNRKDNFEDFLESDRYSDAKEAGIEAAERIAKKLFSNQSLPESTIEQDGEES